MDDIDLRPDILFKYAGLGEFWVTFNLSLGISGYDANGLPMINMITEIAKRQTFAMEERDFWTCVNYSLMRIHEDIVREIKKPKKGKKRK